MGLWFSNGLKMPFKITDEISFATESPSQKIEGPLPELRTGHQLNEKKKNKFSEIRLTC